MIPIPIILIRCASRLCSWSSIISCLHQDLERNIKSPFFADDTMIFSIVKNPEISANDFNHDLDVIYQWAHQRKFEFNPDPIKQATEVLFSNPNRHIMFNINVVAKMNEQKHWIQAYLFKNIYKKNLGIIKHLPLFLTR